jgi:16S rRNA (guanine527-N7)-methyltransferase
VRNRPQRPAAELDAIRELAEAARANGLTLSAAAIGQFETYIETLLLWRTRLSLTTAATVQSIVRNHIADSLFVAPLVKSGFRVADLGSGAGFPGVPLSIACPGASIVLVEARRKKANFLREVLRKTGIANAQVVEARAESLAEHHGGTYDLVVSRAVWRVADFLGICDALLRPEGAAVAMKGPRGLAEGQIRRGGSFAAPEVVNYRLQGSVHRMLLVFHRNAIAPESNCD